MQCPNCGSENRFEGAAFCKDCHQPLQSEPREEIDDSPELEEAADFDLKESSAIDRQDSDEEESLGLSDPIDFVMGRDLPYADVDSKRDEGVESPQEKSAADGDDRFKLNITGGTSGTGVKIETVVRQVVSQIDKQVQDLSREASTDAEYENPAQASRTDKPNQDPPQETPTGPQEQDQSPELSGKSLQQNPPQGMHPETEEYDLPQGTDAQPVLPERRDRGDISEEEVVATQKVRSSDYKHGVLSIRPRTPAASSVRVNDLPRVSRSRGIILLSGNNLILTGGTKVESGDEVRIGDQLYEVRIKIKDNRRSIAAISAGAAVLLLIIMLAIFAGGGDGRLVGMLIDDVGNTPLAERTVHMAELNRSVQTNLGGFFIFDDLAPGLYTLQYMDRGSPVSEVRIAIMEDDITTVTLHSNGSSAEAPAKKTPAEAEQKTVADRSQTSEKGQLKLKLSPHGTSAYLDDKPLGVGSNTYNVKPGKYVLSARKTGYVAKSQTINIEGGQQLAVEFSLQKEKSAGAPPKTTAEKARENELAGNFQEALKQHEEILRRQPQNLPALLGKARCHRNLGSADLAVSSYMQAAGAAGNQGDVAAQIEAYSGVIETRPNTLTAYQSRGDLLFDSGKYSQAAGDYEKVIQLDTRNLGSYYKLGRSYYHSGQYHDALGAFQAAENLNFADPRAQIYLAETYLALDDRKKMKKSFEKFEELASYSVRLKYKNDPEWQKVLAAVGAEQ